MPENNLYFDCHFHPVFKQFITMFEQQYPSTRKAEDFSGEIDLTNNFIDLLDDVALHILESQCCISQMEKGNVQLGIANIVSLEHGIADSRGFIGNILKSNLTRPLDLEYFNEVKDGKISYYMLMLKELSLYRNLMNSDGQEPFRFLTRKHKINIETKGLALALSLEGGHNLCRTKIGNIESDMPVGSSDIFMTDIVNDPALSLKELHNALWENDMDLFYLTLTHLTHIPEQFLATHAFGMKILDHPAFYPTGNGITEQGKEVIDAAYTMKATVDGKKIDAPVLIDIKHMSITSRRDLYVHRRNNPPYQRIPIVASHMGVAGYSIAEWKEAIKEEECAVISKSGVKAVSTVTERKKAGEWGAINKQFTFNPWSINLMDEDIVEVLHSNGLIGLSLDVRILGFQTGLATARGKEQEEYLSIQDFKTHFPNIRLKGLQSEASDASLRPIRRGVEELSQRALAEKYEAAEESQLIPTKEERHPLCLCFNIMHIVSIGKQYTDKNPLDHICIGSDFDGLIDPVKICRDSSAMPELEMALIKWLPVAESAYMKENGGPQLLKHNAEGVDREELQKIVRRIMYENGRRFVYKWYFNHFGTWDKSVQAEYNKLTTT